MAIGWSKVSSFKSSSSLGGTRIYLWSDPASWSEGGSQAERTFLASILVERPCCSSEERDLLAWFHEPKGIYFVAQGYATLVSQHAEVGVYP